MAIQIQLRRGTANQHTSFVGVNAELTVDTTNYALRLHNGSTAGGIEILRKDLANLADSAILNSKLANSSVTINGQSVSLGGSTTITATATNALTIGTGLSGSSYNGSSAVTIALSNTGVTAAAYGSATQIPVLTINAQGQITAASTASVASSLSIAGDTGTDSVSMLTDTLTISGGTGLSSAVTNNNVTLADGNIIRIQIAKETQSYYDYEMQNNESKRKIKLLKPEFVPPIESEFRRVIK
jgi:hypothetical protein